MHQNIYTDLKHQIQRSKRRSIFKRAVSILACTVMFCTTYALILPAITMEQATFCGLEEHTHGEECYGTAQQNLLICNAEHLDIHTHSARCYDPEGNLVCGLCDYVAHSHDSSCYSAAGELVCSLPERSVHVHTDSCYVPGETLPEVLHVHSDKCNVLQRGDLICTLEEQDGHAHGDACYEPGDVLLCTKQENHIHGDSCYETPLVCTQSTQPHAHGADCYGRGSLICTTAENHVHGDGCRETVCICENTEEDHSHSDECYSSRTVCALPENHSHSDACYESIVVCGKAEGECHSHNSGCYGEKKLICTEDENHVHSGSCYEPRLICTRAEIPGHAHSDDCYEQITVIGCGLNEGEPEPTEPVEPVLVCTEPVAQVHVHGDGCFETVTVDAVPICGNTDRDHVHEPACYELHCGLEEHVHDTACYSNPDADLETPEQWEASFAHVELTGDWNEDVLAIARTQLGYVESANNYVVWEDGTTHGYTRYGDWYGSPHGDWCAMFVSFCLHYAEVEGMPLHWGVRPWIEELTDLKLYHEAEVYDPKPGDLIFYDWEGDDLSDHVGFVAEIIPATEDDPAQLKALEGNSSNCVQYVYYDIDDSRILGYSELPDNIEIYSCGLLRHSHNEYCYDDAGNFICQQIEHIHTDVCEPRDILFCGLEIHTHGDSCFNENGELVCEIPEHAHTDACYIQAPAEEEETEPTYDCALEEHIHGDGCFNENGELICEIPEHTHNEACTAEPVAPTYYCGLEEHTHSETCYNEAGELVCEIPEHTHNEECTAEPVTYYCGLEEHTHSETCYNEAGELACEIPEHTHNEECTAEPVTYYCGLEEHTHSETCYNEAGELVCEIPEHTHYEECTTEPVTYYCFKQEHTHTEVCYDEAGNLLCQVPEHTHTDECTKIPVYLCGMEEHAHGAECYDETGNLICQLHEHTHSEQCIIAGGYICGMTEHTHNENCYDAEGNFICTLEEHIHTDACKAQNAYACGLVEHTHGEGCFDEEGNLICQIPEHIHSAACVGRNLYYSDMQIRVHAVIRGVEDLPQKLTLKVRKVVPEQDPQSFGDMQVAVNEQISTQEQYLSQASFYEMYLLSEGEIYNLPETASVTVTMEFEEPVFTPDAMENAIGTHSFMLTPEGGMQLPPDLPAEEETPAEITDPTEGSLVENVISNITSSFQSILTPALALDDASQLEEIPAGEQPEGEIPDDSLVPEDPGTVYDVSGLTGEDYGNAQQGITSITFETNRISTFAVALANTTQTGNFWQRVNSLNDITSGGTYMIVSSDGNYALSGGNNNYEHVQIHAVKGNEQYFTISNDTNNNLKWIFTGSGDAYTVQNVGNGGKYLTPGNDNTVISNSSSAVTISDGTYSTAGHGPFWRFSRGVRNSWGGTTTYHLYNTGSAFQSSYNVSQRETRNMLIFKLVNATLTIPSDVVGSTNNETTTPGTAPDPNSYQAFINPGEILVGINGTAVTDNQGTDSTTDDISVVGSYYSDNPTSDIERGFRIHTNDPEADMEAHRHNDGKVLTDKTVIYRDDAYSAFDSYEPNTFGVTLSTLGQAYQLPQQDLVPIPVDVVFVLDVSGSMQDNSRITNLVSAVNKSMKQIMEANEANRVGIAVYSSGSDRLLPLDRYTATGNNYISSGSKGIVTSGSLRNSSNSDAYANKGSYGFNGLGTFTQAGIASGYQIFDAIPQGVHDNTGTQYTVTVGEGENEREYTVNRQPVFVLVSDGEPTHCTNVYNDPLNGPYYGNGWSNANPNSSSINAKGVMGYYTVLTANYFKRMIGIHYDTPTLFYTIGMGIAQTGTMSVDDNAEYDGYKRAVLNPAVIDDAATSNAQSLRYGSVTLNMMRALLNETPGNTYDDDYITVGRNNNSCGSWVYDLNGDVPVLKDHPYDNNYAYATEAFFGELDEKELEETFGKILTSSTKTNPYGFILYKSRSSVELVDNIGQGMEIKGLENNADGSPNRLAPQLLYGSTRYSPTSVTTANGVTTIVYSGVHTDPLSKRKADLTNIRVSVTTDGNGYQTIRMYVPDIALPVYIPDVTSSFYYEALPVRLIYQVGLTEASEEAVLDLHNTGGKLTFYANRWDDGYVANSTLLPHQENPYYFNLVRDENNNVISSDFRKDLDHHEPKVENTTETYVDTVSCAISTFADTIINAHKLGNNGKLVFEAEVVDVPVEKQWVSTSDTAKVPVEVTLYRVEETTSETGVITRTATPVETITLSSENSWMYTFQNVPAPAGNWYYAIAEDVPDGFVSSCNGEIVELNVDGQPLNASKVTFDDNGAVLTIITNTFTSVELPKTGGPGTILYTTGGLLLIAAAIFLLFYNRKSQISRP